LLSKKWRQNECFYNGASRGIGKSIAFGLAEQAEAAIPFEEMIQPEDITQTIRYLLNLSQASYIKDVTIECRLRIK